MTDNLNELYNFEQDIQFDPIKHEYTRNNNLYTSVTTILKNYNISPDYNNIPQQILENAAKRGTYVHSVFENYIKKGIILDHQVLQPFILYVTNRNIDLSKAISEETVYNDTYLVAGQIDFQYMDGNDIVIADFKTTSQIHWDAVSWQLSIYTYMKYHQDILSYYTKHLKVFHIVKGQLDVKEVPLIPFEEVEALLEANLKGQPYTYKPNYTNVITLTEADLYRQIRNEIFTYKNEIKRLENELERMDNIIIDNMNKRNLHSFSFNDLSFKLSVNNAGARLDTKAIREYFKTNNIDIAPFTKQGAVKTTLICNDLSVKKDVTSLEEDLEGLNNG